MKIAQIERLKFNSDKYTLYQKEVHFFGVIYDENGIYPASSKVDKIKKLSSLTKVTELQKVLGIITYIAPFIPHLSDLTSLMRDLLKKETEYREVGKNMRLYWPYHDELAIENGILIKGD